MLPGDSITLYVGRQTLAGLPAGSGYTTASNWRVVFNGASQTPSTVAYIGAVGNQSYYSLVVTLPAAAGLVLQVVEPTATDDVCIWSTGEVESFDLESLAALLSSSVGVSASTVSQSDFGTIVMGDSFDTGTLVVPLARVSKFGYTDLSGMTISAALKNAPADSPVAASASIISTSARTIKAYWGPFPAGLNLSGTEQSKTFRLDIQLKKTADSNLITVVSGTITVIWQADTTT